MVIQLNDNMTNNASNNNSSVHSDDNNCTRIEGMLIPVYLELDTPWKRWTIFCILAFGILGNVLTIGKIIMDRRLRKSTYIAIALLAVADLMYLLHYLIHVNLELHYKNSRIHYETVFMGLKYGFTHLSASHVILFLSVRFYITVYPLRAKMMKKQSLFWISSLLWLMSGLFAFTYYYLRFEICINAFVLVLSMRMYLLIVPVLIIVILHIIKVRVLGKAASRHERHHNPSKRMSILTSLIVGIYISAALLYPICFVLSEERYPNSEQVKHNILLVARYMWLINASANPVLYFLHSRAIYNSIRKNVLSLRSYLQRSQ